MTFERSFDYAVIRSCITHPKVYPMACDDFAGAPEDFQPNEDDRIWYVLVRSDAGELLGLLTFLPQSTVCWEIHVCLLPVAWGSASTATTGAIAWIFEQTTARRIVAAVPVYNRLAVKLALDTGLTQFGRNPTSFMRGGKLHDTILLGISKDKE